MNAAQKYERAIERAHNYKPAPFNPQYDPTASRRYQQVTESMERDHYYDTHTREECRVEWRRRYDKEKQRCQDTEQ